MGLDSLGVDNFDRSHVEPYCVRMKNPVEIVKRFVKEFVVDLDAPLKECGHPVDFDCVCIQPKEAEELQNTPAAVDNPDIDGPMRQPIRPLRPGCEWVVRMVGSKDGGFPAVVGVPIGKEDPSIYSRHGDNHTEAENARRAILAMRDVYKR